MIVARLHTREGDARLSNPLNWRSFGSDFRRRAVAPTVAQARVWRDWVRENDPVYAAARHPGAAEKWALGVVLVLTLAVVLFRPSSTGTCCVDR